MRFRLALGCWSGAADSLYFIIDTARSRVVWWYKDKDEAERSLALLNKEGK